MKKTLHFSPGGGKAGGFTCSPLDVPGSGTPSFREGRGPTCCHPGDARSPPSPPRVSPDRGSGATGAPSLPAPPHAPPRAPPTAAGRARHSRDRTRAAPGAPWRAGPSSPCCSACSARWCPPRMKTLIYWMPCLIMPRNPLQSPKNLLPMVVALI
ncbi:T-box transcription factor TBX1-like isoform X4 [Manis pentadactyla]|uniref:T-box transcription factor TBX1-like isoform X4 n=1 Tax=Manis pentadactyla TaxID=143292 RepID=UPI00255C58E3|nr:T-box transcription factor TBX1-like isoform X4 [Manis pentadactyla]